MSTQDRDPGGQTAISLAQFSTPAADVVQPHQMLQSMATQHVVACQLVALLVVLFKSSRFLHGKHVAGVWISVN